MTADNDNRKRRARHLVALVEDLYRNGNTQDNLTDAMTDLCHQLKGGPALLERCLTRARDHYKAETREPNQ